MASDKGKDQKQQVKVFVANIANINKALAIKQITDL